MRKIYWAINDIEIDINGKSKHLFDLTDDEKQVICKAIMNNALGGSMYDNGNNYEHVFVEPLNKDTFKTFVDCCKDYIENQIGEYDLNKKGTKPLHPEDYEDCDDPEEWKDYVDEVQSYKKELRAVSREKDQWTKWEMLLNSGIFHDANGEVIDYDRESVTYTTCY